MKTIINVILFAALSAIFLPSCSMLIKQGEDQQQAPIVPLSCIAVLPASTVVDDDDTIDYETAKSLERGARYADTVLVRELSSNQKVRLLERSQLDSLVSGVEGGLSGTESAIGRKVNCDGVLITTIQRFKQREGSELASDAPASAQFQMVLRHSKNGAVLWSTDFNETQHSYLSNIFSLDKMQTRGLKWVSVEQLMEGGIVQRLSECPYL